MSAASRGAAGPGRRTAWIPRGGSPGTVQAGIWWDAIRMPRQTGLRALEVMRRQRGRPPGPVITDPQAAEPRMYFLVPITTAVRWDAPGTVALGESAYVVVPDISRTEPPGLHWTVPPDGGRHLTDPGALREALRTVIVAS